MNDFPSWIFYSIWFSYDMLKPSVKTCTIKVLFKENVCSSVLRFATTLLFKLKQGYYMTGALIILLMYNIIYHSLIYTIIFALY